MFTKVINVQEKGFSEHKIQESSDFNYENIDIKTKVTNKIVTKEKSLQSKIKTFFIKVSKYFSDKEESEPLKCNIIRKTSELENIWREEEFEYFVDCSNFYSTHYKVLSSKDKVFRDSSFRKEFKENSIYEDYELKFTEEEAEFLIERLKKGPSKKAKKLIKKSQKFYQKMKKKEELYRRRKI